MPYLHMSDVNTLLQVQLLLGELIVEVSHGVVLAAPRCVLGLLRQCKEPAGGGGDTKSDAMNILFNTLVGQSWLRLAASLAS